MDNHELYIVFINLLHGNFEDLICNMINKATAIPEVMLAD